MSEAITYQPIGWVESPFTDIEGMPIQPTGAVDIGGTIHLDPAFSAGLKDLDGFSHIIVLYHLHRCTGYALEVVPFLDTTPHGIFATRSPKRPNPIGLSVLRLVNIDGDQLHVQGIDILNGTPVLDIKPYLPAFDSLAAERIGWFAPQIDKATSTRADARFR